jgi:hypothetical protein
MEHVDFSALEEVAGRAILDSRFSDAIRIYLFMGDGDPSLDAGYLAQRLGYCYEQLDEIPAARYWYGRAVEENPVVRLESVAARKRLGNEQYEDMFRLTPQNQHSC